MTDAYKTTTKKTTLPFMSKQSTWSLKICHIPWNFTPDTWHMTCDTWPMIFCFLVFVCPFLSISVHFGIGATIRTRLLHEVFVVCLCCSPLPILLPFCLWGLSCPAPLTERRSKTSQFPPKWSRDRTRNICKCQIVNVWWTVHYPNLVKRFSVRSESGRRQ